MSYPTMFDEMAEALLGCVLRCQLCHRTESPDRQGLVRYLRQRWPECCGETTILRRETHADRIRRGA